MAAAGTPSMSPISAGRATAARELSAASHASVGSSDFWAGLIVKAVALSMARLGWGG
jgi:hypothetical protein